MGEAALWGVIAASSLIVGAEVAIRADLDRRVVGLVMALGVGMLFSSIAFELVLPASDSIGALWTLVSFLVGALAFFVGDWYIGRLGGNRRKGRSGTESHSGLGIVLGTVLDGIPESAVLGMSLASGGGVSGSLLAAIWTSNIPEALGSTQALIDNGMSVRRIRSMWVLIAAMAGVAAAVGHRFVEASSNATGGAVEAFAAGALLTMIADEMAPEAFERSGLLTGLATAVGFVIGFALTVAG
jgi:zinc transporter, ZIP family